MRSLATALLVAAMAVLGVAADGGTAAAASSPTMTAAENMKMPMGGGAHMMQAEASKEQPPEGLVLTGEQEALIAPYEPTKNEQYGFYGYRHRFYYPYFHGGYYGWRYPMPYWNYYGPRYYGGYCPYGQSYGSYYYC